LEVDQPQLFTTPELIESYCLSHVTPIQLAGWPDLKEVYRLSAFNHQPTEYQGPDRSGHPAPYRPALQAPLILIQRSPPKLGVFKDSHKLRIDQF
jgi:hypothetical protein